MMMGVAMIVPAVIVAVAGLLPWIAARRKPR